MHIARCECGGVELQIEGDLRKVVACHCSQCRKTSGHFWAATAAPVDTITVKGEENLKWYESSDFARRGFCSNCGASMIYHHQNAQHWAIAAGCIIGEVPPLVKHIFVADKGAYYDITDGLPQLSGSMQDG